MSLTPIEIERWAAELADARRAGGRHAPITSTLDLTLADAYAIQRAGTAIRLARGERIVGWKLGYTSLAMRAQMGVDEPNFGPLTDAMLVRSGDPVGASLMQPRVEPEIGLRFAQPLAGAVTITEVLAAVESAFAVLEVVDSVYPGYRFRLEDNTADGSSAAQVVVGPALSSHENLDDVRVTMSRNGAEVGSATGAAASGHPAAGVVWLVGQLALTGRRIEAGDLVITGGLTHAVPLEPGDHVEASFDGATHVATHRPIEAPDQSR
jgi:2-keto-4-pentenoate hydratase